MQALPYFPLGRGSKSSGTDRIMYASFGTADLGYTVKEIETSSAPTTVLEIVPEKARIVLP